MVAAERRGDELQAERIRMAAIPPVSAEAALALSVSVVIPVKNEAANLPHVFRAIPDWVGEVVLVDGGSTDNTVEVALGLHPGIKIVRQAGAGKGDALLEGFAACGGDIIVAMDGDGSNHGREIVHFVSTLAAGADFVKGSRFVGGGRSDDITVIRRCGNRLLLALVNGIYGTRYSDLCYGYNAFWSRHLGALAVDCDGFEVEALMSIRAAKAGLRIHEIPSYEYPRLHGTSNLRTIRDGSRILRVILRERFGGAKPSVPGRRATAATSHAGPARDAGPSAEPAALRGRPDAPAISVVICTHLEERLADVLAAVDSVRRQTLAPAEIIVVTDHNPALHRRLASTLPDVVVVENAEARGLSGGRNTGIAMARGDIVAFLDDDAVADPGWLGFFADSYSDPAVAGVGGLTLPRWDTRRPRWFPGEFDWVVGCSYVGMPASSAPVRNLHGGNASFRREVFGVVSGFRSGIGRSAAKRPLGCEETELCIRLRQQLPGSVLLFESRAVIWHKIPAERCRFGYFLSRCYAEGLSKAMVTRSVGMRDGLSAERNYSSRTLPAGIARGVAAASRGDPAGLGRSAAIIAGLGAAGVGYCVGSVSRPGG